MKPLRIHLRHITLGWIVGIEPTHIGITTRGLNHLAIPTIKKSTNKCDGIRTQPCVHVRRLLGLQTFRRVLPSAVLPAHHTTCHNPLQCFMSSLVPYRNTLNNQSMLAQRPFAPCQGHRMLTANFGAVWHPSRMFLYGRGTENRTLIYWLKASYFSR